MAGGEFAVAGRYGMGLRGLVAIWVAKVITLVSRALGWGGSSLPGRVVRIIDPRVLEKIARQSRLGNVLVTGTNGKTTSARMIGSVAMQSGLRVAANRTGANLIYGVTSAYVQACDLRGRLQADMGIIEVDEATMPAAASELAATGALVTNFFSDQLDRFGEPATAALLVKRGIDSMPAGSFAVLNSDDPLVSSLGHGAERPVTYYGIEDESLLVGGHRQTAGVKDCLHCGAPYEYEGVYYAHLGLYRCPSCGASRPVPRVAITGYSRTEHGSEVTIRTPGYSLDLSLGVPGVYDAYNALGAVGCCLALGFDAEDIRRGLEAYSGSFGRMESIRAGDKTILMALVKNAAGFSEVIRTITEGPGDRHVVICLNDNIADGADVSWIWDVDMERLAGAGGARSVIASGVRAGDMAVRLKYAGMDPRLVTIEYDLHKALAGGLSRVQAGGTLYVLPTYTAMLEMRRIIHRMGYARMFWED